MIRKSSPFAMTKKALLIPWKNETFKDFSKANLLNSCRFSSNFFMKNLFLPKDFTVLILLTVSEIKDPMSLSVLYDLEAILLTIDMWIDEAIMRKGVKANVMRATYQQLTNPISKPIIMVVELRHITAKTPVTIL